MTQIISQTDVNIETTKTVLERISDSLFNGQSLVILFACLATAVVAGGIFALLLRRVTKLVARVADASTDLSTVNRLRRLETWLIISIAILRIALVILALYFWWTLTHEGGNANALIGASALAVVLIGGILGPLLRDFAFGAGMMAERWFGVGDLVTIDFPAVQGVVERITLRSTRIRGLNGEVIWVANQTINGVKVAQRGVWSTAIEIFATDPIAAEKLVKRTNTLLPGGLAMLASPLKVIEVTERDKDVWHITAVGETAPGRDWILTDAAIRILKQLDEKSKNPILIVDPVSRYSDQETERQMARAVKNAKKKRRTFGRRKPASS